MRPKSALIYLGDIQQCTNELLNLIEIVKDENNEIEDLFNLINRWTFESIVKIFLGIKLNCLDPNLDINSDANKFISAVKLTLGQDTFDLVTGLPLWKIFQTPKYKRFDEAIMTVWNLSKKMIDEARNLNNTNDQNISLFRKLVQRCEPGSNIPFGKLFDGYL